MHNLIAWFVRIWVRWFGNPSPGSELSDEEKCREVLEEEKSREKTFRIHLVINVDTSGPVAVIHSVGAQGDGLCFIMHHGFSIGVTEAMGHDYGDAKLELIKQCSNIQAFRWALPYLEDDHPRKMHHVQLGEKLIQLAKTTEVVEG